MEVANKKLQSKTKVLNLFVQDTEKIIEQRDPSALERHVNTLETKLEEVHHLKIDIQEMKFEEGEDEDKVKEWSAKVDTTVAKFEVIKNELKQIIKTMNREEAEKEEHHQAQRRLELEKEFQKEKFEQTCSFQKKLEELQLQGKTQKNQESKVKLPKLIITKFKGTHMDWFRFWNQYEVEIDKADISPVSKFSYLKELLIPTVRATIDGLPLTVEGYERAKQILKGKYGKTSEVVNSYVQCIMSLPNIHGTQASKVHDFYAKLSTCVQALESMGKLNDIKGYARLTLDKLEGIRADLVRVDDHWQDWGFSQLLEAVRKWTERNPLSTVNRNQDDTVLGKESKRDKLFQATKQDWKRRPCVYCEASDHKSSECEKVSSTTDRKKVLMTKALCFNCTGQKHKASECRSQQSCIFCKRRHHTSICEKDNIEPMKIAMGSGKVIYPVVVVKANGMKCRALLDTGAGSSYASAALLDRLNSRPIRKECRRIEMVMGSCNKKIDVHQIKISDLEGKFDIEVPVTKVHRGSLLTLQNPRYQEKIHQFPHLKGITMNDRDTKPELPIQIILGASEYAQIKTATKPRVGQPGEPIAELTRFGWTMMSPGPEVDVGKIFIAQTSSADYENLCRLDVLGLKDSTPGNQEGVYEEFKEQLTRSPEGWYQTALPWKGTHPALPNNEIGSLRRLNNLSKKLEKQPEVMKKYDNIIKEQLAQGIVEQAPEKTEQQQFYLPHKPVLRESAESTKLRIVYDGSARANERSPSLNECLETGPPLQNLLWDVLVRNRFYPVAIVGDLKQAFLQVRIIECDRDVMRFHWYKNLKTREVETLRFTRALFGLAPSPFLLGGVIEQHLDNCQPRFPKEVDEIKRSLYVDDLIGGGKTREEALHLKESSTVIFDEAQFQLHKWHSSDVTLEVPEAPTNGDEQTYAKAQLGVKEGETKLLGLQWNKTKDTIAINFPYSKPAEPTKRETLSVLAKIYDPLGLASPIALIGKLLYRDICESRIAWDKKLPSDLATRWYRWQNSLPPKVEVPRSLVTYREEIQEVELHAFGDASGKGVAAAVFAVVRQSSGTSQRIVVAKSRLAKQQLTIPRQELVSAHMATNLLDNVSRAIQGFPVVGTYGWLDSTVALHWIRGDGEYKQFVHNRVRKIQEKSYIQWRYVNTSENPADLGSRGGKVNESSVLWLSGPTWLSEKEKWPHDVSTKPTKETQAELKPTKDVLAVAMKEEDAFDHLLEKHELWKTIRIMAWIARFLCNCRAKDNKKAGPITTEETEKQMKFWIRRSQARSKENQKFEEEKLQLNLQENKEKILECRGRIQGDFPVYLPHEGTFSQKLVANAHKKTLHGGVGLTMTEIRQRHWIPQLRKLVRKVIKGCHGCKRFQARALANPPKGNLPRDRTEGTTPFQIIGVDYAGPITYRKKKSTGKAYILLYSCSLTRALYLDLLPDLSTEKFLFSLKQLVARRGRPEKIYSDNGSTFVAAAKWIKKVMKDEQLQDWLARNEIKWQFNLSRAPWWGGQFERMVGLVKQAFYKVIGNGLLQWRELQEVILDIETILNARPLGYVEEDIQMPLLTPNTLLFGQPNLIPQRDPSMIEDTDLRKRAKYLRKCKDVLWSRWSSEYLKSLRERHNLKHDSKEMALKPGDVVLIKGEERNRGKWKIGIVDQLFQGRDQVVRGIRLRAGRSYLERPIQHLFPLELSCDITKPKSKPTLDAQAPEFRPKRKAATAAKERIANIAAEELDEE